MTTESKTSKSRIEKKPTARKWSGPVTHNSRALALEPEVFKGKDPRQIAASLKRSADSSNQRKGTPFQSAMSMLNFYINRAGHSLPAAQKSILERAKAELRKEYGRG
jgi:hypothetical protein